MAVKDEKVPIFMRNHEGHETAINYGEASKGSIRFRETR